MTAEVHEAHDIYKGDALSYIETSDGGKFFMNNPTFDIKVIAAGLAKVARFNGQSQILYTVGQHSLMVAEIMEIDRRYGGEEFADSDPLEGLLHDATEAYLSDVPAPFKQFLPDWKVIDAAWEKLVRADYKLPPKKSPACNRADWIALFIEANAFMLSRGEKFVDPEGYRSLALHSPRYRDLHGLVHEQGWRDTEQQFLAAFERYSARRPTLAQAE